MNSYLSKGLAMAVVVGCIGVPTAVMAGAGNGAPSGAHYNLNIIGVEKEKKSSMTGSNRHTIFMPLVSKKTGNKSVRINVDGSVEAGTAIVDSKIWLAPGATYRVCDGNGFDFAYGCDDSFDTEWNRYEYTESGDYVPMMSRKAGAVFELPCNSNVIPADGEEFIECDAANPSASYTVWARALGKPGGNATVTTCATVDGDLQCSLENTVDALSRGTGKSYFTDVTQELTSLKVNLCEGDLVVDDLTGELVCDGTVTLTRVSLFGGDTQDWFWNYDNNGLRLAQLRFYPKD